MKYTQTFTLTDLDVDCFCNLKLSSLLFYAQEVAGKHSALLGADYDALAKKNLFWAVSRHKVQITRLPRLGETITVETWPMPTTKVAYPRALAAYDAQGNELFRSISIWVLMDLESRAMVLPGKSGVEVAGWLAGNELTTPHSIVPKALQNSAQRTSSAPAHLLFLPFFARFCPCHSSPVSRETSQYEMCPKNEHPAGNVSFYPCFVTRLTLNPGITSIIIGMVLVYKGYL